MKRFFCLLFYFFISLFCFAQKKTVLPFSAWWEPQGLELFRKFYPDFTFVSSYDKEKNDWLIHIIFPPSYNQKEAALYWCESRFLPESELNSKNKYLPLLHEECVELNDPSGFSSEYIEYIKKVTSKAERNSSPVESPFLYDLIYSSAKRKVLENHIEKITFLGKKVNVHERLVPVIKKIEKKYLENENKDKINSFIKTLDRVDCYSWREVRDLEKRSFHSIAIAIDILPHGYYQKNIYWGWNRQWNPESWFLTPLDKRWMPDEILISLFKEEGFIWGGDWIVWDNMHFEYRPELVEFNKLLKSKSLKVKNKK